jgi:hypothetical protein
MWLVRERAYVMLVRFSPLHGCLLIRVSATLSDMSDSFFTAPTSSNASNIRWWFNLIINADNYYDVDYFTIMIT